MVTWSLAACARAHKVTILEIAQQMGITLKRVREVRAMKDVPEITAWNFVVEITEIWMRKRIAMLGGNPGGSVTLKTP